MNRIPVFYATTEGHTRRIAETIASTLRDRGFDSEAVDVSSMRGSPDWAAITSVVVGGSLHAGKHQSSLRTFVEREAEQLNARPAAFFSVSLSAGSRNLSEIAAARDIASKFVDAAHWRPCRVWCVAGKLAYTKYGFFTRWMMRRISAREGGPTDTTRDHDLTDWNAVREFARAVASDVQQTAKMQAAS
jgi:menaquinone-dependent protoporphyrinogen oxidase